MLGDNAMLKAENEKKKIKNLPLGIAGRNIAHVLLGTAFRRFTR